MTDLLIIGAGLAASVAASEAAEAGLSVVMVAPLRQERAQSVMAMGGMNAALDGAVQGDSPEQHFLDTMAAGHALNDAVAVRALTSSAPRHVAWLAALGVNFNRERSGALALRSFGGQALRRTVYAGAHTGKQIMTALSAACRRHEATGRLQLITGHVLHSLLIDDDGACYGALLIDRRSQQIRALTARVTLLATGALNALYLKTSGSTLNEGVASAICLRQGVEMNNLEMVQFHPTTIQTPTKRMLITEAARSAGARLYTLRDGKPWYFMEEWFPEHGALMPRDVVSRAIHRVVHELGLGIEGREEVMLDMRHLSKRVLNDELDEVVSSCQVYLGLDPLRSPIPVYPGVHYFMGGIRTDAQHRTSLPRFLAAGECSSQYHGANRIGGNSLLGAVHGGYMSARTAAELIAGAGADRSLQAEREAAGRLAEAEALRERWLGAARERQQSAQSLRRQLGAVMNASMGLIRDGKGLEQAAGQLSRLADEAQAIGSREGYLEARQVADLILLARAMLQSASQRRESRGAHQRSDYPEQAAHDARRCQILTLPPELAGAGRTDPCVRWPADLSFQLRASRPIEEPAPCPV